MNQLPFKGCPFEVTLSLIPGEVESSCWQMLEADDTILAKHEDLLDSLIASKPTLARKLILLGRTKRPRTS